MRVNNPERRRKTDKSARRPISSRTSTEPIIEH